MARAPKLKFDANDHKLALEYASKSLGLALAIKLEPTPGGRALLNPKTGATYNIHLSPQLQDNIFHVAITDHGRTVHGEEGIMWVASIHADSSVVHLIATSELMAYVAQARSGGNQFQGLKIEDGLLTEEHGQYMLLHINFGWATEVKLIKRTIKLKGKSYLLHRGLALREKEEFAHLHVHSYYSLLDGTSSPEQIAEQASLNGQPACAITDHGVMYGTYKFWKAAKDAGVKPLLGVEAYMVDNDRLANKYTDAKGGVRRFEYHQTLLAMNQEGWENLCELMSLAAKDYYYYVPRISHEVLFKHKEGIICLSGCFKGMVAHHLQHYPPEVTADFNVYRYDPDRARAIMQRYKDHFGDRYYVEVHSNDFARYMDAVPRILQMADDVGVQKVVANDAHFTVQEDAILQQLMTKISNQRVDEIGEKKDAPYYLKCRDEIVHPSFTPDMYTRTCEIAERCTLSLERKEYLFPKYKLEDDVDWAAFQNEKV